MERCILLVLLLNFSCAVRAQKSDVTRVEFNSGTRSFREQIILTTDSIVIVQEDFRVDLKPRVIRKSMPAADWQALTDKIKPVQLSAIPTLKAPSDKRTYDAAAHGSLIITTGDKSYKHGFDDEEPHVMLKPLMLEIAKFRKK